VVTNGRYVRRVVTVIALSLVATPWLHPASALESVCIQDGDGSFTKQICITAPAAGTAAAGVVSVTGRVDPVSGPRTQKVEFFLDGQYVLTDFRSSSNSAATFDFELPTEYWVDGAHRLEMRAVTRPEAGFPTYTTQFVGLDLAFDNGITEILPNTNTFTPSPGRPGVEGEPFTIAAVGDGASGELSAEAVADLLVAQDPNMLLYLGDVYEKGTRTEFYNWYGEEGRSLGRLRSVTNPTVGNHEYEGGQAPGYFDYWDNVPDFYSFDAAGWHVVSLNSNAGLADSPEQFSWLMADIAANRSRCTIAYWHHPAWSIGTHGSDERIHQEWRVLVEAGVDIVLAGHDHNYQRWEPLGPEGQLDDLGAVSFVVGTGGHGVRAFAPGQSEDHPLVARASDSLDAVGALFLELGEDRATYRFVETNGTVFDQGSVSCADNHRDVLDSIAADLEAAAPTLTGKARDKASEAAAELNKALLNDKLWTDDGSLSDQDGAEVFNAMKRAVEDLLAVTPRPTVLTNAIAALVELSQTIAQERLDEAVALNGDAGKIAEAREAMNRAAAKLATGEPNKAIEEYKRTWEKARDAGGYIAIGSRGALDSIAADLEAAAPTLTGKARDKASEAAAELNNALLNDKLWSEDGSLSDHDGSEVFNAMKRAVEDLLAVTPRPTVLTDAIGALVELSQTIAQERLDEAVALGGDPGKIAEAREAMNRAAAKLATGEPNKAIEEYRRAWEKARDA
jgi:Calcineurin-like phosphoesterase